MIKAVLFDADGTLMDSIASWRKALKTVLGRRGFPYSEEDFQVLIPLTTKEGGAYLKEKYGFAETGDEIAACLLYTSPSPRDYHSSRMPSSA